MKKKRKQSSSRNSSKKILFRVTILFGAALALVGGYALYQQYTRAPVTLQSPQFSIRSKGVTVPKKQYAIYQGIQGTKTATASKEELLPVNEVPERPKAPPVSKEQAALLTGVVTPLETYPSPSSPLKTSILPTVPVPSPVMMREPSKPKKLSHASVLPKVYASLQEAKTALQSIKKGIPKGTVLTIQEGKTGNTKRYRIVARG